MDKNKLQKAIGQRVKAMRTWKGKAAKDVTALDTNVVWAIERGEKGMTVTTLYKLCVDLDCEASDLLPPVKDVI